MNNTVDKAETPTATHEGPIKTPRQLITTILLAFILPIVIIFLLINLVLSSSIRGAGSEALSPEAIATRIKPVAGFALVDASAPKVAKTGQQVYESTCASCHATGVADAPKLGDAAAWGPLINEGFAALMKVALEGEGAMPARGGNPTLSDFEIARAVVYMTNQAGGSFPDPVDPDAEGAEGDAAAPAAESAPAPAADTAAAAEPAPAADTPADAEPTPAADTDNGN